MNKYGRSAPDIGRSHSPDSLVNGIPMKNKRKTPIGKRGENLLLNRYFLYSFVVFFIHGAIIYSNVRQG
jgi:hypothetical protein